MNEANPIPGAGPLAETRGTPPFMDRNVAPSTHQAWDKFGVLLYCLDFCDCVNIEV